MMNNDRHGNLWYVRLYKSFFDSKAIKDIERLPDSKYTHNFSSFIIHLYFKMVAYSTESNGNMVFILVMEENDDLAYSIARTFNFVDKLGEVKQALIILEQFGLIQTAKTDEYNQLFIPYVPDNTGRLSLNSHQRQQRRLAAQKGKNLDNTELKTYGRLHNVYLTEDEYESLERKVSDMDGLISRYGLSVINRHTKVSDYDELLKCISALPGE